MMESLDKDVEKRDGGRFVKGRLEEGAQKKMVGG